LVQRAFDKYGGLVFEVVCFAPVEQLDWLEQCFLDVHVGSPSCMNLSGCAEATMRGYKHSEEARSNMRKAHLGKQWTEAQREQVSKALTGRTLSPEHKANISQANLGRQFTDEHKATLRRRQRERAPRYRFEHENHGVIEAPLWYMVETWPELNHGALGQVAKGKVFQHKGWRLAK
jgi:hypothetical protein